MDGILRRQMGRLLITTILMTVIAGCNSDRRLVELSRESLDRQAEQNRDMAKQNQSVTETTQQLIKAESSVQSDAGQLQQQLHAERSTLDEQRQDLENDRRSLGEQRLREPIIAESIKGLALIVVAALPLIVCWYLAKSLLVSASEDSVAAEILIEQLAAPGPVLAACNATGLPYVAQDDQTPQAIPSGAPPLLCQAEEPIRTTDPSRDLRVVVVVEGCHDAEFLKRISHVLSQSDTSLPDLGRWESARRIAFVVNNGAAIAFPAGLSSAGPPEFHLLDRETAPVTLQRQAICLAINSRSNCRAVLTAKRMIENYLHPEAIREVCGQSVDFGDFDDVPEIVARSLCELPGGRMWASLSRRTRRRLRDRAKRWLNRDVVDRMTPQRLAERDPEGEVLGWLRTIAELATAAAYLPN